jgi:hypothetical protein
MQTFAVVVDCVACPHREFIYVEPADYIRWSLKGVHAQDAFPYLTEDEREALITSMCLDCIDEMYSDMEEEDEYMFLLGEGEDTRDSDKDWYVD